MLTPYEVIFLNSLKSSIITAMFGENAWFAAILFGSYSVWGVTLAAILGSAVGNCLNFAAGYFLARKRLEWFSLKENIYQRASKLSNLLIIFLALPFSSIPAIGVFWSLYVLSMGFFSTKPVRSFILLVIGRFVFYGYYLWSGGLV